MDYGRQGSHEDDDMQPYFHPQHALMQPWSEPMQQQPEDIPWNYDQFGQFGHFPPQPSGAWPVDHYPPAPLDFQGAQFHPTATLPPPDFEPIPTTGQLIPDDELDSLLNPHPPGFPSDLEPNHPEFQGKQRVRQRISSPAKAILQKWFDDHIEDPYLEREDVSTLSEATGLTARQRRSNTVVRERTDQSKIFQCTFCNRDFAQKYDWRRHEESVHIPQKEWICMPDGPVRAADDDSGLQFCVFCEQANPSYEHLQRHNYAPCLTAPQPSRTFTRKDKLIQHLGQVHKQSQMSPTMQTWCRRVSRNIAIACGICGVRLSTWNERVEHISAHFADGLDMRYWLGAPGGVVSFAPTPAGHHHHHYEQSSSSASTTNIDPLFPAYNSSTSSIPSQTGFHHPCTHCPVRFPRYSETVFHERRAHRVYKIRPQPTEDGSNIMNPLQPRTEKLAFSGGGGGGAAGAAGGVGRGGAMASVMQQQHHHRAADAPVAAMLLGGGSGRRSKALLGEDGQKGAGRGGGGAGTGRPFWRDQL
ncbi:c2h2 type zinc finger containing protein [Neofusicoccum parvum]|uniref:C2h2 type zinc finger containing protein n=1 Tax=Neofusicoccum parvum TaxID=310453 RepID=A0ACB5S3F9_9PEZI|nr:c2h2 type zinc finger containing protein [Neofusicoccum parvum]